MKLVLFDIDGTLLDCGGQTRELLAEAAEAISGTAGSLRNDGFAGKTDDQIVYDALSSIGIPEGRIAGALDGIKAVYFELLSERLDAREMRLLPGVEEALDRLAASSAVCLGLLTGNWEVGARRKLERYNLNRYFPIGAFGDGCRDRLDLPPVALDAARRHYRREFDAREVLIVGDTENDVRCARGHGIAMLGVATGSRTADDLRAAGADWVIDNLLQVGDCSPLGKMMASEVVDRSTGRRR